MKFRSILALNVMLTATPFALGQFTITKLDGINNVFGSWMNDQQQVVSGKLLWTQGTVTDLGSLGGSFTAVEGVNEFGQVIGRSSTASGITSAFIWQSGVMTALPSLAPGQEGYATDINNLGQVVGYSDPIATSWVVEHRATLWPTNLMPTDLGTLPPDNGSRAYAINDLGHIAGISLPSIGSAFGQDLVLWNGSSLIPIAQNLTYGEVTGMNNHDRVIGFTQALQAFYWENGTAHSLGTLGGTFSFASGINDAGEIVGRSSDAAGNLRAFLFDGTGMHDLNAMLENVLPSPATLTIAWDINSNGDILLSDSSNALYIATRINAVPEPSTYSLVAGLALVLLVCRQTHLRRGKKHTLLSR